MNIDLTLTDAASPQLRRLAAGLADRQPLMTRLGKTVLVELHNHFAGRESRPNKKGWPKSHFWSAIRRATALGEVTADTATVTITHPAIHAIVNGGTFTHPDGAYAIPLRPEAKAAGKPSSGRIPGLFLLKGHRHAFLAKKENTGFSGAAPLTRRRMALSTPARGQRLTLYYLLVKTVTRRADPDALPSTASLQEATHRETTAYLAKYAA
jgi:phage gpG-like protein